MISLISPLSFVESAEFTSSLKAILEMRGNGKNIKNKARSLDSDFKCNTCDEVGCCDEEIQAFERRRTCGGHDREGAEHERQGDCQTTVAQRIDDLARAGTQSYRVAARL